MRICTHPKHLLSSRLYCRFRIRTGSAAQCAVHGLPRSESERCHRRSGIYESLISPCPEELLFTLPHYCMHVALICQPVFSISLPISWAFRAFSSFTGFHTLLAYLGIHFHIRASICHQIVTKIKLSTDIQQAEPLHLRADSLIVQMIVNRISNSQILLSNQRLQNFKVTSFCSHLCYICMPANVR